MAEYTKIETAMAIICDLCGDLYLDDFCPEKNDSGKCGWRKYLEEDAADVAPVVHGRWQGTADGYADGELVYDMWECSVCGFDADGADEKPCWKYCPNCGARMGGDGDAID